MSDTSSNQNINSLVLPETKKIESTYSAKINYLSTPNDIKTNNFEELQFKIECIQRDFKLSNTNYQIMEASNSYSW